MESRSLRPTVTPGCRGRALLVVVAMVGCAEGSSLEETTSSAGPTGSGGGANGAGGGGGSTVSTGGGSSGPATTSSSTSASSGGDGGRGQGGEPSAGGGGAASSSSTGSTSSTGAGGEGGQGGQGGVDRLCPADEFVTGIAPDGALTCAPFDAHAQTAIAGGCSLYLGHRDNCTGCTTAPAKWGWARTGLCANGLGVNGTCAATLLNGNSVSLYGLNTSGDVDDNDKIYASFHCAVGDVAPQPGPCAAGAFVSAVVDGVVTCTPSSGLALGRVRSSCHLYLGWRDECTGCTTAPSKWGRVNDAACANGLGSGNTCTSALLGAETVRLFGLNTGGDVDENDKLHLGLRCDDAADGATTAIGTCPTGTLVHGIDADGTLRCASPAPQTTAIFRSRCTAYFGVRDGCTSCTTAPSKWGLARANGCANGVGAGNTCAVASLGGQSVSLFGLNTQGDVDENDKLYVGFECE